MKKRESARLARAGAGVGWVILAGTLLAAETPQVGRRDSTPEEDARIKRREVYEFTSKPTVTREGDRVLIRFASRDFCDATVALERNDGTIIRHLACGVLGPKAPPPFQPDSLEQTVVWDGKNDWGVYVDDWEHLRVRVSLGLKAQFERTLYWHPKKRVGTRKVPRFVVQPEGVYVYEGAGVEPIRLFGHDGTYIRTVHPFPSDAVRTVKGVEWQTFPDGYEAPTMRGYWRSTFLQASDGKAGDTRSSTGATAFAFDVRNNRVASVSEHLSRLHADGTPAPFSLIGPATGLGMPAQSVALSPDGKWLYMTGCYMTINRGQLGTHLARVKITHGVYRMEYGGDKPAELWLGSGAEKAVKDDSHFDHPSCVIVDEAGRVYIADNHNDRVQIFSPEGDLLKSLPVSGPALLQLHHKTQDLYVFSWTMALAFGYGTTPHKVEARLRVFEPFKSANPKLDVPLPLAQYRGHTAGFMGSPHFDECPYRAALDSYTEPPTVWMNTFWGDRAGNSRELAISRFRLGTNGLERIEMWNDEVAGALGGAWKPTRLMRKRLYADPGKGTLYVADADGKWMERLTRIDPATGTTDHLDLPYVTEEFAFDPQGRIYLRPLFPANRIGRFDLSTMREVPFDYGEETRISYGGKAYSLRSALPLPGNMPVWWHTSGMGVNPQGDIVVACCNSATKQANSTVMGDSRTYTPQVYPGRFLYEEIHVWDKHGKVRTLDAVRGVMDGHGTFIDPAGDIYLLAGGNRVYDGKRHYLPLTGCVMKFKPGKGRFINNRRASIPFTGKEADLQGLPHVSSGGLGLFAVEGAEWVYPGVGFVHPTAPCQCWNARFALDTFGRTFAPESVRHQVAVLDSNGNLMMRIGRYGNVDEGKPLIPDQRFRSREPRALGGDEVAMSYANYVATHTDHRLFIYDAGNDRVLSVKLDYHAKETIPLKEKPE